MSGLKFKIEGINRIRTVLDKQFKSITGEMAQEIQDSMSNMELKALQDAPTDQGLLKAGISVQKIDELTYDLICQVGYAPFIEFGTRLKVQIPSELQAIAGQFRGAKSEGDAKKMIYDWCKRKGIEESGWYPIYRSIMINGIRPRPFFFKQLEAEKPNLIKNLKRITGSK